MKATRVITKGALVTLRARKNKNATIESLYLDYYSNGKRAYKFLGLYLYVRPKTDTDRVLNEVNKQAANQRRTEFESEIMHDGLQQDKGGMPLLEYMEKFKNYPKVTGAKRSYGTIKGYGAAMALIKEFSGDIKFKDVDEKWVNDFRSFLLEKVDQGTARTYFSKLSSTLAKAVKEKIIKSNPMLSVDGIAKPEVRFEFLSFEELKKLKETPCDMADLKRAALTSAMTGMRGGDLVALKWGQIQYSEELGNIIRFEQEKSEQEEYLPINPSVLEILGTRKGADERVFPKFKNTTPSNLHLKVWVARAGITRRITFHSFRHTHAILLATHGNANLFQIKEILGHSSISTTEQHYARIIDKTKREVINRLPDL